MSTDDEHLHAPAPVAMGLKRAGVLPVGQRVTVLTDEQPPRRRMMPKGATPARTPPPRHDRQAPPVRGSRTPPPTRSVPSHAEEPETLTHPAMHVVASKAAVDKSGESQGDQSAARVADPQPATPPGVEAASDTRPMLLLVGVLCMLVVTVIMVVSGLF